MRRAGARLQLATDAAAVSATCTAPSSPRSGGATVLEVAHGRVVAGDLRQVALRDRSHAHVVRLLRRFAELVQDAVLELFELGDVSVVLVRAELRPRLGVRLAQRAGEAARAGRLVAIAGDRTLQVAGN